MRVNRYRIRSLAQNGNIKAKRVEEILEQPERLISAILLGNNFVNILASVLATALFISLFGEKGILYATVIMTVVLLIFGEITPKTVAAYRPENIALLFSQPMKLIIKAFNPIVRLFSMVARGILGLFGLKTAHSEHLTEEDVGSFLTMGHEEGFIPEAKAKMLIAIMDMDAIPVRKVMLPLNEMMFVSVTALSKMWCIRSRPRTTAGILCTRTGRTIS